MVARLINALFGAWLFASAFLWDHSAPEFLAATIAGLVILGVAVSAGTFPQARWVNAVAAAALFSFTMSRQPADPATRLHDALIAVAVFLVSLVPSYGRLRRLRRRAAA